MNFSSWSGMSVFLLSGSFYIFRKEKSFLRISTSGDNNELKGGIQQYEIQRHTVSALPIFFEKGNSVSSKTKKRPLDKSEHGKSAGFSIEVTNILDQLERDRQAGTPVETAVGPLRERLRRSPDIYQELVEALVAKATEWSAPVLHMLLNEAGNKDERKGPGIGSSRKALCGSNPGQRRRAYGSRRLRPKPSASSAGFS
jgi:hypothetical protein